MKAHEEALFNSKEIVFSRVKTLLTNSKFLNDLKNTLKEKYPNFNNNEIEELSQKAIKSMKKAGHSIFL